MLMSDLLERSILLPKLSLYPGDCGYQPVIQEIGYVSYISGFMIERLEYLAYLSMTICARTWFSHPHIQTEKHRHFALHE